MTVGNHFEPPSPVQDDRVGKPFLVVHQNARKCLVCERIFTRQAAPQHAQVVCFPPK
jgi:hypothetical protein